uniref:uncharacterized protein LOC120334895 n=1 Tax=Styela clava TaxID=7725 RepID=UPI00193A62D7|nr:uncharacterized protein LOC120334895 [Styela clava]
MKPKSGTTRLPRPENNGRKSLIARKSGLPLSTTYGSKISKLKSKERKVVSGIVQNVFQNKASNSSRLSLRKSVRFKDPSSQEKKSISERKTLQSVENSQVNIKEMEADNFSSQFINDFEFKSDPDALASILNDEGVSSDLLKKTQLAEGKSADEFLLAGGRPSLCRRVPINRTSDVRSSILSSRVSMVPGRVVARTSTTGRSSFMNPRSSVVRQSGVRNSLFTFIERRYSQKHQEDTIRPTAPPVRNSMRASVKPNQPKKVEFADESSPVVQKKTEKDLRMSSARRILSSKPNQQNIAASPALRLPSSPNPYANSPAVRVKRSIRKTPGKSCLVDDVFRAPKVNETPRANADIATTLSFSDDENQSPTQPQPKGQMPKVTNPRKSISRLKPVAQVNKRQSLQKPTSTQIKKAGIPATSPKSKTMSCNYSRYSSVKIQPPKPKIKEENIRTLYVEAKLDKGEELVQPKILNDEEYSTKTEPENIPQSRSQPIQKSGKNEFLNPKTLNDFAKNSQPEPVFKKPAKVSSKIPSFGFKTKKTMVDADDVLELINKKLATVKRRSVQAELSSFMKSLEKSLGSVHEEDENNTEEKEKTVAPQVKEESKLIEEVFCKRSSQGESMKEKRGLKPWKEVLAAESSPTWRDIFKKEKESPDKTTTTGIPISAPQTTSPTTQSQEPAHLDQLRKDYNHSLEEIDRAAVETKNIEDKMKQLQMMKQDLKMNNVQATRTQAESFLHPEITPAKERIMKALEPHMPADFAKPKQTAHKYFGPIISTPDDSTELASRASLTNIEQKKDITAEMAVSAHSSIPGMTKMSVKMSKAQQNIQQNINSNSRLFMPTKVSHSMDSGNMKPLLDENKASNFEWVNTNQSPDVHTAAVSREKKDTQPKILPANFPNTIKLNKTTQPEILPADVSNTIKPDKTTELEIPPTSSPNTIKPDTVKSMSWEKLGNSKTSKITSGRIGLKSQHLDKEEKSDLDSAKCDIIPVSYPAKTLQIRNKNSPILKEKLSPASSTKNGDENFSDVFSKSPNFDPSFADSKPATRKTTIRSSCSSTGFLSDTMLKNVTFLSPGLCERFGMTYEEMHKLGNATLLPDQDQIKSPATLSNKNDPVTSEKMLSQQKSNSSSPILTMNQFETRPLQQSKSNSVNVCASNYLYGQASNVEELPTLDTLSIVGIELSKNLSAKNKTCPKQEKNLPKFSTISSILKAQNQPRRLNVNLSDNSLIPQASILTPASVKSSLNIPMPDFNAGNDLLALENDDSIGVLSKPDLTPPTKQKNVRFKDDFDLLRLDSVDLNSNEISLQDNKETNIFSPSESGSSFQKDTDILSPFEQNESLARFFNNLNKSSPSYAPVRNLLDFSLVETELTSTNHGQNAPIRYLPEPLLPIPSGGHRSPAPCKPSSLVEPEVTSMEHDKNAPIGFLPKPLLPQASPGAFHTEDIQKYSAGNTTQMSDLVLSNGNFSSKNQPTPDISGIGSLETQYLTQPSLPAEPEISGTSQLKPVSKPAMRKLEISGTDQLKPVLKPAVLPQPTLIENKSGILSAGANDSDHLLTSTIRTPKPVHGHRQAPEAPMLAAPRPLRPPPPQTPAAFRLLRSKNNQSSTPKKCRFQSLPSQSPSRGIKKTPRKRSSILASSPSIKIICKKRFSEALLDEEVALLTCRNFRNTVMTPRKQKLKETSTNPLGRVLMEGDDTHFIPLSPIAISKPTKSSAMVGSAFSTFAKGT